MQKKQIQAHLKFVKQLHQRNVEVFKLDVNANKKKQYLIPQLVKVQFDNGWFCKYTDNYDKKKYNGRYTIMTFHGFPGNHIDWAPMTQQMSQYRQIRSINFVIPGYDMQDQRRGNYRGNYEDLGLMINLLLKKLKISKIVINAHSGGNHLACYLIKKFPNIVEGYISICSMMFGSWTLGTISLYQNPVIRNGFYQNPKLVEKLSTSEDFRQQIYQKFEKQRKQIYFNYLPLPQFQKLELMAHIKLSLQQPSQLLQWGKNMKITKVQIFADQDPYYCQGQMQKVIYDLCNSNTNQQIQHSQGIKAQFRKTLKQRLNIEINNESSIQSYFCYCFKKTGHNAHKRRATEIAKIIEVYLIYLEIKEKYEILAKTKL